TDSSPVDQAAGFSYAIDWGDGSPVQVVAATPGDGAGITVNHIFTASGSFTPRVRATDKDGGVSGAARPESAVSITAPVVATTIQLDVTPNPVTAGQATVLTATVVASSGTGIPTGTVTFTIDGISQPPVGLQVVGGSALATFTFTAQAPGDHEIGA